MSLPKNYQFLMLEPGPKILHEALKLYGTQEFVGHDDNPVIMDWAKEIGVEAYNHDSLPWCGLFAAVCAHRAGKTLPVAPLWARNWLNYGEECKAELGCILVFSRGTGGHVGIYVGEDRHGFYHVLGGNQGDSVSITRILKERLLGARAQYKQKPHNIRRVYLDPEGKVSQSEA
jgi:uncharacterized protein (TIGR02594 family)